MEELTTKQTHDSLGRNGWAVLPLGLSATELEQVLNKKKLWLHSVTQQIQSEFETTISEFDEKNIGNLELAKGIVRAFFRYDNDLLEIGKSVYSELRKQVTNEDSIAFCTLPYAIIHWPKDSSEKGPMHKDGYYYIQDFYTTWTPLNDCIHDGLAVVEHSHHQKSRLATKLRLPSFHPSQKEVKPNFKFGNFAVWNGNTDHEGLLNTSDAITVAIVFRFTCTPIMLEATQHSSRFSGIKISDNQMDIVSFSSKMALIFRQINRQQLDETRNDMHMTELCNSVAATIQSWSLTETDCAKVAFVLTIWAQRMESKQNVFLFFLYACIASTHSFYPLQQVIRQLFKEASESNSTEFMKWIINKHPYRQVEFVLREQIVIKNRAGGNIYVDLPKSLPYATWPSQQTQNQK